MLIFSKIRCPFALLQISVLLNSKYFQGSDMISVSRFSVVWYLPTYDIFYFFGEGKCTSCPSIRSKSFSRLLINWSTESHSEKIRSDASRPIHAYLSLVGSLNVLKMICSGANKKIFPKLSGPMIIIFLNFPGPCSIRSRRVAETRTSQSCYS